MSQDGKVLHLYVEVRSVAEDGGKVSGRGDDDTSHLVLQCPDVLPHSQRSSTHSSPNRSPAASPVSRHHPGSRNHSLPSSKSSRHSVSFHLQNPDATGSPTQYHRQNVLPDGFDQLLEVLAPGTVSSGRHGSLGRTFSLDVDPYQRKVLVSPSSGGMNAASPPTRTRRPYEVEGIEDEQGKTSVVSFGYIEKSNVHNMAGRRASACQNEYDRSFNKIEGQLPAHLRKRLSDPVWSNGHHCPSRSQSPRDCPSLQKVTLDSVTRDAASRTLDDFGSPELKRRFAGFGSEGYSYSPTLPRQQQDPRCRSWGGSPVLPRTARTLPPKPHLLELDRGVCHSSMTGLPRSPASDQLCAHTGHPAHAKTSAPHSPGQQRPRVGGESPRSTNKFHPPLPAGRPTDIQHGVPAASFPSVNKSSRVSNGYHANVPISSRNVPDGHYMNSDEFDSSRNTHCKWSHSSRRLGDGTSPTAGRRSVSPSSNPELACKLAVEATRMSSLFADRRTPSPTSSHTDSFRSDSPKSTGSFLRESQPYATLHAPSSPDPLQTGGRSSGSDRSTPQTKPGCISPLLSQRGVSAPASPALLAPRHRTGGSHSPVLDPRQKRFSASLEVSTLHRHQPPQYTGDHKSPGVDQRPYLHLLDRPPRDCSGLSHHHAEASAVSWTSRQQERREARQTRDGDHHHLHPSRLLPTRRLEYGSQDGGHGAGRTSQYQSPVVSGATDQREDALDHSRVAGTWSQSSSGVTGSLDDRHHSPSPETSSQSSHETEGSPRTQSSVAPSRSQRIARAKWEFLFGGSTEEKRCSRDTTSATPPTSSSPSPTPPSSLRLTAANQRRGRDSGGRKLSHHEIRQIEVELLSANAQNANPRTGIIRRTIKYSETDLDAVPLRCYRETDLDEVMRAEAEAAEEADSAFSSNRSFSPANSSSKGRTSRGEEVNGVEEDEEEEEEEEEGVVSWASVRMQGDKQRQRAAKEEAEVLGLLLKGSLEASSDCHGGLKSPISVGSPRRPSDSNLDSFSRHFESIMESHRAKGTSYSSLDSVDLLTSGSTSVFTFDLPTLTPEIQSQICESAKQIIELSFAPLSHPAPSGPLDTSHSEISLCVGGAGPPGASQDDSGPPTRSRSEREAWRRPVLRDGFRKASSVPALHSSSRERPVNHPPELIYPQADVAQRLAPGGSDDALANGTKADLQSAKRLAKRLYSLDGFRKSDVARHLGKNNDFSQMVAEEYLCNFNFTGQTVDQALRLFLRQFALMGETQERERVLVHFSRRFRQCNPDWLQTEDSVHTLTCAIMLLNTDLHGNNVGKRMSCNQFISNLEGLNNGKDFPKELLKSLYSSIKNEKLQWTIDEEELRKSMTELADTRTDSASHTMKRLVGGNLLVGVAQQVDAELYKSGFLVRKVHADPDGKRTPRGKRGWKTFYGVLKGLVLYLQKEEYRPEREVTEEDVKNAVSVHHSLAMRAADYSKRPNVFYLRTADWRVFLFQAPNPEQMHSWITRINVVAAMFSAPPFPAAIGSQKRFSRPLLPGSNTKLSQDEQIKSHESRFRAVSSELAELAATSPDKKVKGREQEEHKLRREYLEFEKTRYGTYAMLLRAKLASGVDDLSAFESRLFDDGGLQRAHSSPALPQDATAKEKTRGSRSLKVTTSSSKSDGSHKNIGSQRAELQRMESRRAESQKTGPNKAEPQKQNNSVDETP